MGSYNNDINNHERIWRFYYYTNSRCQWRPSYALFYFDTLSFYGVHVQLAIADFDHY